MDEVGLASGMEVERWNRDWGSDLESTAIGIRQRVQGPSQRRRNETMI